uniref:Major sperm protein n=2 Tax=Onchocerca TaxID=6281 RepID=A0A8R1TUR6_ONCVO
MKFPSRVRERNFLLRIEPRDKLIFVGNVTGEIHTIIKLTNESDSRQAFKVKCTRNDLFHIRPATGILEFGQTIDIDITYSCMNNQVPESNRHYFAIYHIPAPEGATCIGAWAEHYGPPQGELRMKPLVARDTSSRRGSAVAGVLLLIAGKCSSLILLNPSIQVPLNNFYPDLRIGLKNPGNMSKEMNEEASLEEEEDWRYKYRSAFTYAPYNDLDKMGYEAPKRYPTQVGPRYCRYSYSVTGTEVMEKASLTVHTAAVESIFVVLAFLLFLMTLPFSLIFSLKFVSNFERLVVLRLGRAQKTRGPGATVVLPCIDTYTKVDLRVNAFNVPPMQIITFDRGLVELGATVFSQVKDALAAVCAVQERNRSTRILSIATLNRLVCKRRVSDVTSSLGRRQLCENLQIELGVLTTTWGVEITKVELSEVKVIKEGENMALATFSKVLKSELGSRITEMIKGAAQDFVIQQQQKRQTADQQQQIEDHTKRDITDLFREELCEKNESRCALDNSFKNLDIDRLLCSLTMVIDEQLVASVGQIFQVKCTGFGDFYVDLKSGSGHCCKGISPTADVTFWLNRALLLKIIKKEVTPMQAYLDGSLRILGSVKAAIKLTLLSDRFNCLL